MDFLNYEKIIDIESEKQRIICDILCADSEFLRRMKLIDYSILLTKINHKMWED
jgi:hypothetical protein